MRRVRFPAGRRAVTVTFKSDLLEDRVELLARLSADALSMSASVWRLPVIWIVRVVQKLARNPPDLCDALPDIG